jgi:hypothetical protein
MRPAVHKAQPGWRRIIAQAVLWGIPTPAFSTALAFFDGYRSEVVPANLLQAQRDYFGAHTFRVMPGKENERLKTGEDIRASPCPRTMLSVVVDRCAQTSTGPVVAATSLRRATLRERLACYRHLQRLHRNVVRLLGVYNMHMLDLYIISVIRPTVFE